MRRLVIILMLACLAVVVGVGLWLAGRSSHRQAVSPAMPGKVQSVLTNVVESAKNHFTGGVGVLLRPDNGRVVVQGVGVGSPAEAAGLCVGDVVLQVNGVSTAGMPLAQLVENFRGFTGGKVEVSVQRAGNTNVTCVIRRASWNTLRGTTFNQAQGTNAPAPIPPSTNGGGTVGPRIR